MKTNENYDNMINAMEDEQKTMEHQEIMKVDVKNITKNKKYIWRPIYEFIADSFFEERDIFPQASLELFKNNPNQPQFLLSEAKVVLKKKGYGTRIICTSSHDTPKGFW